MSFVRIRFGEAENMAGDPTHELIDLTVEEVSVVDKPANNRPWLIKSVTEDENGVLIVDADSEAKAPTKTATMCEKTWNAMGTLETALRTDPNDSPVAKMLNVNDAARSKVFSYIDDIGYRMDDVLRLLSEAMGTPFEGSLDSAVGAELAAIGEKFRMMAENFGVTEPPAENAMEPVLMADGVSKAGRAMSRARMRKLAETAAYSNHLAQMLISLFHEVGGDDSLMDGVDLACGERRHKANGDDGLVTKGHLDSRLSQILAAMADGHTSLIQRLNRPTEIVVDSDAVSKAVSNRLETASSNQISGNAGSHNPFRPISGRKDSGSSAAPTSKSLSGFMASRLNLEESR
jgi:hypothetical protein